MKRVLPEGSKDDTIQHVLLRRMPRALIKQVKMKCLLRGITMRQLIVDLFKGWVQDSNK